ncbi:unnamed protein product [Paramecium octaurelia]|uniref:Uncharacterized protein n=1 Tax=Paramecium octaurelia TaxID=43137 RepID=A0A8S1VBI8_PAROT|nr:unnamed protein product [Paramecium octaurelia]
MNSIILILASRQEYIFHLQILEAQVNSMSSNDRMYLMQKIQYKILKVEQRRIQIESQTLLNYSEPRKFLQKLVKKYIKIQGYYYQKLQLYFPIFSQRKQFLPMQRNQLFKIASNSTMSSTEIIQIIINLQKERLVRQIDSLVKSINRNEALQTDLITNRNEKFCQDPIQSLEYLNHIHLTYYLQNKPTYKNDPYDIMNLDEQTKEFLMSGFKSYVCCLTKTKNVFIPIESTQEITLFRYEKYWKILNDQNNALNKRITKFYFKNYQQIQTTLEKQIICSVHRLPVKLNQKQNKRNIFHKIRLSKQENEGRNSRTFQDGFQTDKEPYVGNSIGMESQGDIFSHLKNIVLSSSKTREQKSNYENKKYILRDSQIRNEHEMIQSQLVLCGKSMKFPNNEQEKKRILSNIFENKDNVNNASKDKSVEQVSLSLTKNLKIQKQGLSNKYHLIKIKQNCSQLKLQQLQLQN